MFTVNETGNFDQFVPYADEIDVPDTVENVHTDNHWAVPA